MGGGGAGATYYGNKTATNGIAGTPGFGGGGGGGAATVGGDGAQTAGGAGGSGVVKFVITDGLTGGITSKTFGSNGSYTVQTYNTGNANAAFTGVISGTGKLIVDAGTSTMTFSGANTYTGGTQIKTGTLIANHASALGNTMNATSKVELANHSSAWLQLNQALSTGSLGGGGTAGGKVNLQGYTLTTGGNNESTTFEGLIQGTGSLKKTGTGTWTLKRTDTANHSYSGSTEIAGGELVIAHNAPNPSSKTITGIGKLTIESALNSFTNAFTLSNWSLASTLTGLTVGKSTNINDVTLGQAVSIAGPISIYGGNIRIEAALTLTDASGPLTLNAAGSISQASDSTATIAVAGTTSLTAGSDKDITLSNAGNDFTGALSVVSGKDVSLADANALDLGASTVSGKLVITAGGAVSDSGRLAVTGTMNITAIGQTVTLDTATNDFKNTVTAVADSVTLTDINALTLGTILTSSNLTLNSTGALNLGTSTVGGSLNANSHGGDITQNGALKVIGSSTLDAGTGSITLDDVGNDFTGTLTVTAGTTSLKDANALTAVLATTGDTTLAAGGNLVVSGTVSDAGSGLTLAAGGKTTFGKLTVDRNLVSTTHGAGSAGGVSQTAEIVVKGVASFIADTGASQDALLAHASNDFQGEVSFTQKDGGSWQMLTLVDGVGGLTLGKVTASGKLDATAATSLALDGAITVASLDLEATAGAITQVAAGTLSVTAGPTDLKAGTDITLANAGNDFGGTVNATGKDIAVTDGTDGLILGNISASGTLAATSTGGDITQASGTTIAVTGDTTLKASATIDGKTAPANIALDGSTNDFGGTVNADGGAVALVDKNDLMLGTVKTTGDLTLASNGALDLGTSTVGGALNADSGNGAITQSGPLTVTGSSTLEAGTGSVTLANAGNDFQGAVNADGANVALADKDALTLGTVTTAGNLTLASTGALNLGTSTVGGALNANSQGGDITQSGALTVTGSSTLEAGTGSVTLANAGNDFQGAVNADGANVALTDKDGLTLGTVSTTGNLTLSNTGALDLGASRVGGALNANSQGGDITQSGSLMVGGETNLNAGTGGVSLLNPYNEFIGSTVILGQRVAAVGDPRTTKELAGQTADTLPVVDVAGRSAPGSEPPQLQVSDLSAAAVAPEIASGNPTTSVASSSGGVSAGPTIEVFNAIPSAGTLTTVVVSLSVGTSVQRAGFSFELPDAIKAMGAAAEVRLLDGQPLPPWLRFDAKTQRFVAATVPMGALPLQVVVTVGGQRVLVLVREGQE